MVRGKLSVTVSVTIFTCRTSHSASKIGRHPFLAPATAKNGRPHDTPRQATQGFMVGSNNFARAVHFPPPRPGHFDQVSAVFYLTQKAQNSQKRTCSARAWLASRVLSHADYTDYTDSFLI